MKIKDEAKKKRKRKREENNLGKSRKLKKRKKTITNSFKEIRVFLKEKYSEDKEEIFNIKMVAGERIKDSINAEM